MGEGTEDFVLASDLGLHGRGQSGTLQTKLRFILWTVGQSWNWDRVELDGKLRTGDHVGSNWTECRGELRRAFWGAGSLIKKGAPLCTP